MNKHARALKNSSVAGGGRDGLRLLKDGEGDQAPGRVPPHSVEAEEQLLSACLIDGADVMARCKREKITANAFYVPANRVIFERLEDMYQRDVPIDLAVLAEELKTVGVLDELGGYTYLTRISGRIPTTAGASYFIEKIRELWGLRELIRFCTGMVEQCYGYSGGLPDMVNASRAKLERMYDWTTCAGPERGQQQADAAIKAAEDMIAGRVDKSRWLTWGIQGFDELFGAFDVNNEDFYVTVAGLRSQGKSSLARQFAIANLERGRKGVVFNLETGAKGWLMRGAGGFAKINQRTVSQEVRKERLAAYRKRLQDQKAWMGERLWLFEDVFAIDEIEIKIREIHRACQAKAEAEYRARGEEPPAELPGLDFVVLDYIQLISYGVVPRGMNREQQLAEISRRLLLLAKKLKVTFFVLAQLSRKSADEARRPRISDIRESGQIENDSSRVIMLYVLPEGKTGKQDESTMMPECEIIQGKNRNGVTGYEPCVFEKPFGVFVAGVKAGDPRPGQRVDPAAGYGRNRGGDM